MSIINPHLFNAASVNEYQKVLARITACKDKYVNRGYDPLHEDIIVQEVAQSWIRSKEAGVPLHSDSIGEFISQEDLDNRLRANRTLVEIISKNLEVSSDIIKKKTSCVVFADPDGVVLNILHGSIKNELFERLNLRPGLQWQESSVGTTGSILSNIHNTVVQLVGPEHYSSMLYDHLTTAVAISDDEGEFLGTVTLVTVFGNADNLLIIQPLMLGWTMALASSIEYEYRLSCRNDMFAERKTISYAEEKDTSTIIVDAEGIVKTARFYGIFATLQESLGKNQHYSTVLGSIAAIECVLTGDEDTSEADCIIKVGDNDVPCRVSVGILGEKLDRQKHYLINIGHDGKNDGHGNRSECVLLNNIVLESPAMKALKQKLYALTQHKMCSLIVGESGTGKEMLATAIHNHSCRSRAFVTFNCATAHTDFLETSLFGSEKAGCPIEFGKLDLALGGTLYISEVSDMPLAIQGILTKIIERGKFTRVGGDTYVDAPYNILIGTENDPFVLLEKGILREDFFSAISMPILTLPPLRERIGDIIPLAQHFISLYCSELGIPKMQMSGRSEKLLLTNNWPGNVRQLKLAIQYAIHSSNDGLIKVSDFPQALRSERSVLSEPIKLDNAEDEVLPLSVVEKNEISKAITLSAGNIKLCARLLGVSRSTLYRKMEDYGLRVAKTEL